MHSTHLLQEQAQEAEAEPPEPVPFQELKEIDAQLLKGEAEMALVNKGIMQSDNVVFIVRIQPSIQQLQDANLHTRLLVISILVLDDLHAKKHLLALHQNLGDYAHHATANLTD